MEHRWNARKATTGDVIIECPHVGRVSAMMRDVSLGGMFVETVSVLPLNAPITVGFHLPAPSEDGGYRLQAIVVRRGAGGAGLMFLDLGTGTFGSLRNALQRLSGTLGEPPATTMPEHTQH